MAYAFNGTNQHLSTASAPADGYPMTLAMWYRPSSVSVTARALTVSASNGHRHQLTYVPQFSQAQAVTVGGSGAVSAIGTVSFVAGAWYHHAGVFASATDRSVWVDGSRIDTNTTDPGSLSTFDRVTVAAGAVPAGVFFPGDIAEVGVWNVALTAAEIASLAKGVACRLVRPQSLVFYAPLLRDLVDLRGGRAITNNNTATVAVHPRVYA